MEENHASSAVAVLGAGAQWLATAPLAPSLSEILNILLHCRKFLEKLQLIGKIMSLAPKNPAPTAPLFRGGLGDQGDQGDQGGPVGTRGNNSKTLSKKAPHIISAPSSQNLKPFLFKCWELS